MQFTARRLVSALDLFEQNPEKEEQFIANSQGLLYSITKNSHNDYFTIWVHKKGYVTKAFQDVPIEQYQFAQLIGLEHLEIKHEKDDYLIFLYDEAHNISSSLGSILLHFWQKERENLLPFVIPERERYFLHQ